MKGEIKMSKEDYQDWYKFLNKESDRLHKPEVDLIVNLHAKYFNHKLKYPCSCSPKTYNKWIAQLNSVFDNGN